MTRIVAAGGAETKLASGGRWMHRFKGIGTPVEKNIQSVDLFFPVRLIVSLIVY